MSEQSQGPGWWQASDNKWYPPEAAQAAPGQPTAGQGGPGGGAPMNHPPSGMPSTEEAKGFVRSLYDFQFDHFVTPKVLRVLYAVAVILLSLGAVIFLIASLATGDPGAIIFALIVVPIGYLIYLALTRMYFELVSALFRIADDLRAIRRSKGI